MANNNDMLNILKSLDNIQKKSLTESFITECPPDPVTQTSGPVTISAGNASQMAELLKALAGIDRGMSKSTDMLASPIDNPRIPGRDSVPGDADMQDGVLGTMVGAGLGGAAGLALGGPMGGLTGGLLGAATGDQLTDVDYDDPSIPGDDADPDDQDLQADISSALGAAGSAIKDLGTQALQKGAEVGADLGSRAAQSIAGTDIGMNALRKLSGIPDAAQGMVPDAAISYGAGIKGADIGSKIGKGAVAAAPIAALGGLSAMGNNADDKDESIDEWDNEPDEHYSDHKFMTKDLSGGINRQKKMYKPAAKGDNPMAVESIKDRLLKALSEKKAKPDFLDMDKDGNKKEPMKKALADKKKKVDEVATISPIYIQHLKLKYGKKASLSPKEQREIVKNILNRWDFKNIETIMNANIPHVSQMAKVYLRNKTPGGMINYKEAEVQAPTHELDDTARKAMSIAQKIKRKINSGEQMDDRDYNQMAELGAILSRFGTNFGPKSMKDVMAHMVQYTNDRNEEGHGYPEFNVDRFKELISMTKATSEGNAYAHAVRQAKMSGKKKGDVIDGPDGEKIKLERFKKF